MCVANGPTIQPNENAVFEQCANKNTPFQRNDSSVNFYLGTPEVCCILEKCFQISFVFIPRFLEQKFPDSYCGKFSKSFFLAFTLVGGAPFCSVCSILSVISYRRKGKCRPHHNTKLQNGKGYQFLCNFFQSIKVFMISITKKCFRGDMVLLGNF